MFSAFDNCNVFVMDEFLSTLISTYTKTVFPFQMSSLLAHFCKHARIDFCYVVVEGIINLHHAANFFERVRRIP